MNAIQEGFCIGVAACIFAMLIVVWIFRQSKQPPSEQMEGI